MLTPRTPVVLERYPVDPALLRPDVRPFAAQILERHGAEEWISILLTHEFHRHLGAYSMIGAKMGLRARELLDATLDGLTVVSHAGLRPPMSCMNDGLQVATGASLGRGTISVAPGEARPEAVFRAEDGRALGLRLRDEVTERVKAAFREARESGGGDDPARCQALRLWLELDRREMFDTTTE
jgi:pyrimidine-specific ribonucleoside hydrolase